MYDTPVYPNDCNPRYYEPENCRSTSGGRALARYQCRNKPKYGPDNAYCAIHAKKIAEYLEIKERIANRPKPYKVLI